MENDITIYCIPECSEFWSEEQARDYEAGRAMPCPEEPLSAAEESFRSLKEAYVKAYTENPLLSRSRYLTSLQL